MDGYRLSIGVKLALLIAAVSALVMVVSVIVIGRHLRDDADADAAVTARHATTEIVSAVKNIFEGAFNIVDSTQDSLIALRDEQVGDRQVYDTLLKNIIVSGSDRYGAWFAWNPGALPPTATRKPENAAPSDPSDLTTYWHQNGMDMFHDRIPAEILDNDLYRVPATRGKAYLLEPHQIDAADNDPVLVTSFARPLQSDGKVVGVLGIDIKLDAIRDALSSVTIPAGATFSVVSDSGVVAMSTFKRDGRADVARNDAFLKLALAAAKHGDGSAFVLAGDAQEKTLQSWTAIRFNSVQNPWYVLIQVPEKSFTAVVSNDSASLLLVPLAALMTILMSVFFAVHRLVARPLHALSKVIAALGDGLFGFNVPYCQRKDEIGDIARAVERLQASGEQIARLQEESGEAEFQRHRLRRIEMDGIAVRFSRSVSEVTMAVRNAASHIKERSQQVASTSDTAISRLGYVANASATAKTSLASVAQSAQSLSAAIQAIGDQTKQAQTISAKVEARTASTDRSIATLKGTVDRIGSVASVIKAVAGQINLIALNATIEAARAGEMGRGFAVVAQEIKVLASKTAVATDEIGRYVIDVQQASRVTEVSVADMHAALNEMQTVSVEIASALTVQTHATEGIRGFVETAIHSAQNVEQNLLDLGSSASLFQNAAGAMLNESSSLGSDADRLGDEVIAFIDFIKAA